jgi:hypothetical protein
VSCPISVLQTMVSHLGKRTSQHLPRVRHTIHTYYLRSVCICVPR